MSQFAVRSASSATRFCEECYVSHVGKVMKEHVWTITEDGAIDYGVRKQACDADLPSPPISASGRTASTSTIAMTGRWRKTPNRRSIPQSP